MKASLAGMLAAVKSLLDSNIRLGGDVLLAFVIDEEYGSLGTEAIVEKYRTDGAIVTEPTGLRISLAHRGFQWIDIEVIGRAAHGSRYMDGIDANRLMGYFLVALDQHAQDLLDRPNHALLGPPSIHAALLSGGSSQSVYAARAKVELERRTLPGENTADILADIQALVDELTGMVPNFKATVTAGLGRAAFEVAEDAPIVTALIQSAEAVLGERPKTYGELWWMDSALLQAAGIETAIIGPAGAGAHADEEWVDLDSVYDYTRILVEVMQRYCGVV
jgi:acetylornithine deacetylase